MRPVMLSVLLLLGACAQSPAASSGDGGSTNSSPPAYRSTSVRCMATTQSGARCKRMTTNSSGRCYQH